MKRKKQTRREKYEKFDDEAYVNEVLYKDGYRPPERKRKKRRGTFLGFVTFVLGIVIIVFAFLLLFHIQTIEVKGNKHCAQNEVVNWIKKDKFSVNSAYVWWKYNHGNIKQLPLVKSTKITLKNPWTVVATVKEKDISGYIQAGSQYLYFDKDGTALLKTDKKIDKITYIEGMKVDASKVILGKVIPVSDKNVFKRIVEISGLIGKYSLTPDRIVCSGSDLNLYFGSVEVLLGKTNYDVRAAQVKPILGKLSEQFPGKEGTLHLENFSAADKAVRFTPKEEKDKEGETSQGQAKSQEQ